MCLLICTFSGEMGYWDLGERERERAREKRGTPVASRGDSSLALVCLKGIFAFITLECYVRLCGFHSATA